MSANPCSYFPRKAIPVFSPDLGEAELHSIEQTFLAGWTGKGPKVEAFEKSFAKHLNVAHENLCSTNSCTEALFQTMQLLEIGPGDEVILPTISFVGAANAIVSAGARPVFCDVDPRTLNPTAENLAPLISTRTKAIIILHYGGAPCEMSAILELTNDKGIALIEDCAISAASRYHGQSCGTFGAIGTWSFDSMKLLTTGDGGMIFCRDEAMAIKARTTLYLGLSSHSGWNNLANNNWWEFDVLSPSRRSVTNDIAAAIGLTQLERLSNTLARREYIHNFYNSCFQTCNWLITPPELSDDRQSSFSFYWIQVDAKHRNALAEHLRDCNIYTTFRYLPLHRMPLYKHDSPLPFAEQTANRTLCLPIHNRLTDEQLEYIADCVHQFGKKL